MKLDKKIFADNVRPFFGGVLRKPVWDGMSVLLDAYAEYGDPDPQFAAYTFASVRWETGSLMYPVREGFAKTDRGARQVVRHRAYGKPEGPYGFVYYGRGRIQNTWLANYKKLSDRFGVDLVADPDKLLDSEFDAKVTVIGHLEGLWSQRKLSTYKTAKGFDYKGARAIVNGSDHALAVATFAEQFEKPFRLAIAN